MERKKNKFLDNKSEVISSISIKRAKEICLIQISQKINVPEADFKAFSELFDEICNLDGTNHFLSLNGLKDGLLTIYSSCKAENLDKTIDETCADLNCYINFLENLLIEEGEQTNE